MNIPEERNPFMALLGAALTDWGPDRSEVRLTQRDDLLNRHGALHGGVHAMLLDTCMGYAGCWAEPGADPVFAVTLSMTVNYIAKPAEGELIAAGRRIGGGRSVFFADGALRDPEGRLVASATGTFRYRQKRAPAQ